MSSDDEDVVKEKLAEDGRHVFDSPTADDADATDTDEWIASDTTISGSDQQ